ncbi:MAG: DUF1501 domain-containing protein [Gammaproteobacteria bacterium]|nr:DUF1501 domain-containing protein [Gammaproteobacteria bacterium]
MKRRTFLQAAGVLGFGSAVFHGFGLTPTAIAASRFGRSIENLGLEFTSVSASKAPQIINIFLYGGPSELAGNLSNIGDIMANSQNAYDPNFDPDNNNTIVTPNYFWSDAGGTLMEEMISKKQMSIYRTVFRKVDNNRGHGASVTQNLLGNLDQSRPGIGTNLAYIIAKNNPFNKPAEDLVLPIVTLEGDTAVFNNGDASILSQLKPVALNDRLQNPYSRSTNSRLGSDSDGKKEDALEALALETAKENKIFPKVTEAFNKRGQLATKIEEILDPEVVNSRIDEYNAILPEDGQINYANNNFGRRLKAAVSLALENRETMFISLGSGGLGGWDDHSEALEDNGGYRDRMTSLMSAISTAMTHIDAAGDSANGDLYRANAHNIIINVFGDFGRIVNLNDSLGWDHGNNQNFYTFGGKNIRGSNALGKIVGTTERVGKYGQNGQFTEPTKDSYTFEPFAIAASIYKYFGVADPTLLTKSDAFTQGFEAIDESVSGETLKPWPPAA